MIDINSWVSAMGEILGLNPGDAAERRREAVDALTKTADGAATRLAVTDRLEKELSHDVRR